MRVLCIQAPFLCDPFTKTLPIVKEGEVYHPIDEYFDPLAECKVYELEEHRGFIYAQRLFIPLGDEEVEIEEEKYLQLSGRVKNLQHDNI